MARQKKEIANPPPAVVVPPKKRVGGFATMSEEQRKEIATKGGYAVQAGGNAHKWNSKTARLASMKSHENRKLRQLEEEV